MFYYINIRSTFERRTKFFIIAVIIWLYSPLLIGQSLELIDRIYGGIGDAPSSVVINENGQRFYLFNRLHDSIVINDRFLAFPPSDSIPGLPYFFGRSYLVGVLNDTVFKIRPGGSAIALSDSSVFVVSTFFEDTLFTEDSIYINHSQGTGNQNLLINEYDFHGNHLKTKHWTSTCKCQFTINDLEPSKNKIFICGEYSSIDQAVLDQSILSPGYANGMFGYMDSNFNFINISTIEGELEEFYIKMAMNSYDRFLLIGSSTSSSVYECNDSLNNLAENLWGTSFLFSILFDSVNNCIIHKSIDYDYGEIISTSISETEDNSFIVSGIYYSTFISLDGISLFNPDHEQRGFLYKFNSDGYLIKAFQLEGSKGTKMIESVVQDTNGDYWITGLNYSDSLRIGGFLLTMDEKEESFGYLARLNKDLEPNYAVKLDNPPYKLFEGNDNSIYLLESSKDLYNYKLYKINHEPNSVNLIYNENFVDVLIFPNPAFSGAQVSYRLLNAENHSIKEINTYDIYGISVGSKLVNGSQGILEGFDKSTILIFEFVLDNNSRIIKKLLVK